MTFLKNHSSFPLVALPLMELEVQKEIILPLGVYWRSFARILKRPGAAIVGSITDFEDFRRDISPSEITSNPSFRLCIGWLPVILQQ